MCNANTRQRRGATDYDAAIARFDAMPPKARAEWLDVFSTRADLDASNCRVLGYELPALARLVGIGWAWKEARPLRPRDVRRVHAALHQGMAALRASSHVPRATAREMWGRRHRRARATGWRLPPHRLTLRLLPAPGLGEQTSIFVAIEAPDEVAAIVAAFAYFLWRQAPRWRECACECGLTFIQNGKRKYIDDHQNREWSRDYYHKNKDAIRQDRRERRQRQAD